ncbi:histone-like nucleoid-structuring protein Lsr2 [Pseudonocardia acidicola]|uniref:Lsr2 family protein n=1 Tax=Pseudonocardia acidicola TaxID=2724939 RepID=A0ABX1S7E2_9PSEU|nr:Lsr2 family protein [Pseudonocardia acidicola]NMH97461.1 Lsr2 family protein [Pseudonocardia acidicola]
MSQKVEVRLIDDVDGSEASTTVSFALDGRDYEIDLSEDNRRRLDDMLRPYLAAARRAGRRAAAPARGRVTSPVDRAHNDAVRAWARGNGHQVSARGRIPAQILQAYEARDSAPAAAAAPEQPAAEAAEAPKKRTRRVQVTNPFALDQAAS